MESPVPLNIFMLGIGPTINAGIVLNFWQALPFVPGHKHFKKLRKQGQEGSHHPAMKSVFCFCVPVVQAGMESGQTGVARVLSGCLRRQYHLCT